VKRLEHNKWPAVDTSSEELGAALPSLVSLTGTDLPYPLHSWVLPSYNPGRAACCGPHCLVEPAYVLGGGAPVFLFSISQHAQKGVSTRFLVHLEAG